ncbi:hypothetical protein NDU88_004354 [Pleurodeles waltl]|uniref:Uncharacterized protein n=1 Tax=Pleurodeles waltl TaxID=8319 RepID=A0AAV7NTG6_PLEWA|nr:hypothetical protein NDU88_004354 [Pleurodeles waltl]
MCRSTARSASRTIRTSETRQIQAPGEVLGGRLRHWGRAALELRRAKENRNNIWLFRARTACLCPSKELLTKSKQDLTPCW